MRFFIIFFPVIYLFASNTPFDIYKKETNPEQHTLLIIGGIHGDEPGGYFAPAILEKYYKNQILLQKALGNYSKKSQ